MSWLESYLEMLSESDHSLVKEERSDTKFRFGDGITIESTKIVKIPAQIGTRSVNITTDVIAHELPLLLSKDAMKKAKTRIDFSNDKIDILGQEIDISFTSSGHYCIPISKTYEALENFIEKKS